MKKRTIILLFIFIIITISIILNPRLRTISINYFNKITVLFNNNEEDVNYIYGIDVSHHQGIIKWNLVNKWGNNKIEFVYIKATEGATYFDKNYRMNFSGAKKNGLLTGSYHYFRTSSSVKDQFNNFISHISKKRQDLIPLIDVEEKRNWTNKEFHKNFLKFLFMVEKFFGKKPMIYTVNSFYNKHLSGRYDGYHFLIGRYGKKSPFMIDGKDWTIWQFTEKGKIKGIKKNVDIDRLNKGFKLDDIKL